jgi:hypothetical protein
LASPSNSPPFCALEKKEENALLLTTTLQGSTKLAMSTLELIKNGRGGVLSIMFSIRSMSCILTKFEQQGLQKTMKKNPKKKQKNEQTLDLTLHFGSLNH